MSNRFNRVTSIRKSGSSAITTIPKEVMNMLNLEIGDKVEYVVDTDRKKIELIKNKPKKYNTKDE